jgi:hypothetical protein
VSPLAYDTLGPVIIPGEALPPTGLDDTTGQPWAPTLPAAGPAGLPLVPQLDPALRSVGADPALLHAELRAVIERAIVDHPRSQQKRIGPSEVGTPCTRKLAYKLGEVPEANPRGAAWRPTVGTATHAWLADAFVAENLRLGWTRYLLELSVSPGEIDGTPVVGSLDLYDRVTGDVADWKIVGITTLRTVRRSGPTPKYRGQLHQYGRGCTRRGLPVGNVHLGYLPVNGELGDAHWWSEPYDEAVAVEALDRASAIARAGKALGYAAVGAVSSIAEDFCSGCEWFAPADPDPAAGRCPGALPEAPPAAAPRGGAFGLG